MTFPVCRRRIIDKDAIQARDAAIVVIIEMIESDAMQLTGGSFRCLSPVHVATQQAIRERNHCTMKVARHTTAERAENTEKSI